MANRVVNARIISSCKTKADWDVETNIPENGEIIIYSDGNGGEATPRIKVGDGLTLPKNLQFTTYGAEPQSLTINIPNMAAGGTADIAVTGLKTDSIGVLGLDSTVTLAQYKEISGAQLKISAQAANKITLTAMGKTITTGPIPAVLNIIKW